MEVAKFKREVSKDDHFYCRECAKRFKPANIRLAIEHFGSEHDGKQPVEFSLGKKIVQNFPVKTLNLSQKKDGIYWIKCLPDRFLNLSLGKRYECTECDEKFKYEQKFKIHLRKMHKKSNRYCIIRAMKQRKSLKYNSWKYFDRAFPKDVLIQDPPVLSITATN